MSMNQEVDLFRRICKMIENNMSGVADDDLEAAMSSLRIAINVMSVCILTAADVTYARTGGKQEYGDIVLRITMAAVGDLNDMLARNQQPPESPAEIVDTFMRRFKKDKS